MSSFEGTLNRIERRALQDVSRWRQSLVDGLLGLLAVGFAIIVAIAFCLQLATGTEHSRYIWAASIGSAILVGAAAVVRRGATWARLVAAFVGVLATSLTIMLRVGPTPHAYTGAILGVVIIALVAGRRWGLIALGSFALSFALIGLSVPAPPEPGALDPALPGNWIRLSSFFVVIGTAFVLAMTWLAQKLDAALVAGARQRAKAQWEASGRLAALHELQHRERLGALGSRAAGVAHDLNNALTVIRASAGMIEPSPDDRPLLEAVRDSAAVATSLTRQLLDLASRDTVPAIPTDVGAVLSRMVPSVESLMPTTVGVDLQIASGAWSACVDGTALSRAVLNLAINARDALDDAAGTVVLGVDGDEDHVRVFVADDGPGMPEAVRVRALEPFFTTKCSGQGTGLGLSNVRATAERSGGSVDVDSSVGGGTTVSVRLPRVHDTPVP